MNIDWVQIKQKIAGYCTKAFLENHIVASREAIDEAVNIFNNFISLKCNYALLNGLSREIMPALQTSCISNVGDLPALKSLLNCFDPFLKKILVLSGKFSYTEVQFDTFMPLFKKTNITPNFVLTNPRIEESTLSLFLGDSEGTYLFAITYLSRNQVHNSPDWDDSDITFRLKNCLSLYIFIILKLKEKLLTNYPSLNSSTYYTFTNNKEGRLLYDFISFGSSSNVIKNQIVNSFILHLLQNKKKLSLIKLQEHIDNFSQKTLSESSCKRLIEKLINNKKIVYTNNTKQEVTLSSEERERLDSIAENFNENLKLFHAETDELLNSYSLESHKREIIDKLGLFFEENFTLDIDEATDTLSSNTSLKNYQNFISYLSSLGKTQEDSEKFFKELVEVCKANDVIIRLSIGKVFSKISNPDLFDNYIRQESRVAYLDTQILLYALCINENYPPYDNVHYKIATNLIELPKSNEFIELVVSDHYLSEVTHQLKQALLLIPFTTNPLFSRIQISTNVFFKHYFYLHENNLLPQDIETFADYMEDNFKLKEEDAYEHDFHRIAYGIIEYKLEYELGIRIEDIPSYDNTIIESTQSLFESVINNEHLDDKHYKALKNDSLMGCHLFNNRVHEIEPFFLTWDKSFVFFRRKYLEKYKRGMSLCWHLFSPAKFLNHIDLINFKVNVDTLSDDLISVIESVNFKDRTHSVVDVVNKFLDIKNINKNQRTRYIELTKQIFKDEEFPNTVEIISAENEIAVKRFSTILDEISNYYRDKGEAFISMYRLMLLQEKYFQKIITIIKEYVNSDKEMEVAPLLEKINKNIEEFKNKQLENTQEPENK